MESYRARASGLFLLGRRFTPDRRRLLPSSPADRAAKRLHCSSPRFSRRRPLPFETLGNCAVFCWRALFPWINANLSRDENWPERLRESES